MTIEMIEAEEFNQGTQIKVIGVGGGGGNAVEHMIARNVQGVEFVSANTDAQALTRTSAHRVIQLGGSGLGAGGKPEKARDAAEAAVDDIRDAILSGALQPGQRVKERDVAAQMGISTTPVKEALRRLEQEGLVVMIDREGRYFVGANEVLNPGVDTLKAAIESAVGEDRQQRVTLRADARTPHQAVVTAMDALGQLGFAALTIATVPVESDK